MLPRSAFSSFSSSCASPSYLILTSSQITGNGENGGVYGGVVNGSLAKSTPSK